MLLHDRYLRVQRTTDLDSLLSASLAFARWLGFDKVSVFAGLESARGDPTFFCVDNAPSGFHEIMDRPGHGKRDPVMQHCKRSSLPVVWSQATYTSAGRGDMWEEQAVYGYKNGICVALHLPAGRHVCVGFDRDDSLPRCEEEVARLAAELQLFAVHAQDAAVRILLPSESTVKNGLSPRECEALKWTLEGKTAWEVGCILGISEQTAVRHLHRASQKLECVNKHHAAVKALRLGFIHF